MDWAGHSLCRRSQSHKNPGKESGPEGEGERERGALPLRRPSEAATSDHTIDIATQQAEIRPGRRVDGRAPPFAKLATFYYRDRPRGIPGGFPLHSNARASVRCVGSFQRWAKLILDNLDPCFLPRQLATRDRQIHLWRHGVGTETLCGSSSLPPTGQAGRGLDGVSVKMSEEISIAGKENEEAREGEGAGKVRILLSLPLSD